MKDATTLYTNILATFSSLIAWWPVKTFVAASAGMWAVLIGPITDAHVSLFIVWMLDLATGIAASAKEHRLSSNEGWKKGSAKFFAYIVLLILAFRLEEATNTSVIYKAVGEFTLVSALIYLVISESFSVLENISRLTGIELKLFNNPTKLLPKAAKEEEKPDA